jgi:hypothetical protein
VSTPLPRLTAQRREWLTESSTCRYEDLQILLQNYDAVQGLLERHRKIVALSAGWDEDGSLGPRRPYSWETVARLAMDYARAAIAAAEKLAVSK